MIGGEFPWELLTLDIGHFGGGIPVSATGTWMRRRVLCQRKGSILLLVSTISEVIRTKE